MSKPPFDPFLALLGAVEKLLTRLAAAALPWSGRSHHDAYLHGYRDGLADGTTRRELLGRGR